MISVPFPVVTLFTLIYLLAMALFPEKQRHSGTVRFLIACIVLISVSTLRWEYDSTLLRNIQSGLAIFLPPLAWHSFASMTDISGQRRSLLLYLPPAGALLLRIVWPAATDVILFLIFSGYGLSLLRMAKRGEDSFILSRLGDASNITRMTFFAGCFLCISGLTDLIVSLDFSIADGKLAPVIIVIFQVTLLPLIGVLLLKAGKNVALPVMDTYKVARPVSTVIEPGELAEIYFRLDKYVRETQIYLNSELTLNLLARKTGIPGRQVSAAINSQAQCNLSQWINGFRIERARELLLSTPMPVTEIMLESGFITKSNFNREFQRITGASPTLFRQQAGDSQEMNSEIS
ncbi:AraC family transcriptional regulator [Klebsiella sp. BIGb0407]|uniref:helix-turn-helix domain-containing protein n=1 Tax=Klebsiella sp. BIGb0407 TaxID=2940603 RepID=UPI00216886A5|nr:AraC family transcriptional regulator [Klebsiella sp. BIGb0407]MCS3430480.1 AraC-like DNA-binding protein [Klebsiella sp. BIGb0407]